MKRLLVLLLAVVLLAGFSVPVLAGAAPAVYTAADVRFAQKSIRLVVGRSVTLGVAAYTSDGAKAKLTYKSSRPAVAKVSSKGKITALKPGTATITARAAGGKKATATVQVVPAGSAVAVSKVSTTGKTTKMAAGTTKIITAKIAPATATGAKVTFKSSKTSVLKIDAAGKMTAIKPGKTTISVFAGGRKATFSVTVTTAAGGAPDASSQPGTPTLTDDTVVYIPKTGSKFHRINNCGTMRDPRQTTYKEIKGSYEPCKNCW